MWYVLTGGTRRRYVSDSESLRHDLLARGHNVVKVRFRFVLQGWIGLSVEKERCLDVVSDACGLDKTNDFRDALDSENSHGITCGFPTVG